MAEHAATKPKYEKFEDDVRVTISPKLYKWPNGGETTYVPAAIIDGQDEFVELVCRNKTSQIVQKAGVDVGWTMHVKGVILPKKKDSKYSDEVRIGVNYLSKITPRKSRDDEPDDQNNSENSSQTASTSTMPEDSDSDSADDGFQPSF